MAFLDLFSEKADLYASARPKYPADLFSFVASIAPTRGRAWDCGAGNGQAAIGLAKYFTSVEATDASAQQIESAIACDGVHYSVQPAEETTFPAASFDAVCVAQALHWFDFNRFYPEVWRVLKPEGVFVAWSYDWFSVSKEFDTKFEQLILEVIRPYWAPQNALAWNGYRDVPFPFVRLDAPKITMELTWIFPQLLAYVGTWSATRRCQAERGSGFIEDAEEKLAVLWGKPSEARRITVRLHLLAGRYAQP